MVGVTCPIEIMRRVTSEMQAWCKSRIAHFKTPRYFTFVGVFPMPVTGRMQKFKYVRSAWKSVQGLGHKLDAARR